MKGKMKGFMIILSFVCALLLLMPACTTGVVLQSQKQKAVGSQQTTQARYWGLLFAVGVYLNAPDQDRPEMLDACDNLYDCLLDSPQFWQPENIHTVKGSQATLQNFIKELLWLRQNSASDDYVLVYITTHGSPLRNAQGLPVDLPPKDEADGADEILVMYNGFDQWYGIIWDDLLNFFLSIIPCKGLCLIVDSCYSGGFNDPPYNTIVPGYTAQSFTEGFVEDVAAQGRIVLMSTQENTLSYGSTFSDYLTIGLGGMADLFGNGDGINSAQEAFAFAKPLVDLLSGGEQQPTISDLYGEEFPLTTS
jgi:hypothetical protein